jgi:hypothetical protein
VGWGYCMRWLGVLQLAHRALQPSPPRPHGLAEAGGAQCVVVVVVVGGWCVCVCVCVGGWGALQTLAAGRSSAPRSTTLTPSFPPDPP